MKKIGFGDSIYGAQRSCAASSRRSLEHVRTCLACRGLVRQWTAAIQQPGMSPRTFVRADQWNRLGIGAALLSLRQNDPVSTQAVAGARQFPYRMGGLGGEIRALKGRQLGQNTHRRFQAQSSKRGACTGPSPVDRAKCGTAIHLASDEYGMPMGATITVAAANDGQQTGHVLGTLVVQPPPSESLQPVLDPLNYPTARADGAYGNAPTAERAAAAGFRMRAPKRGQARLPGVGRIRCAVERGHAFLSQFGRIARRFDRDDRRYLGWVELAACIIFIRAGFFL